MKKISPEVLQTKQHFEILDGLRGVAALGVVVFHFMEWIYTNPSQNFIGHGFLAVDFFFCLSGFVIAYAYDARLEKMGVVEFFKSRLIRLHPLVVFGSILGLLGFLLDPFAMGIAPYSTGKLVAIFFCSIFLIPYGVMEDRGFNLFGLNAPSWSLFWEYVANIFYAFVLYKVGKRYLAILAVIAALALCFVGYKAGNLLGGWSKGTFWDGGARVAYSFLAGMLIFRFKLIIKNNIGFVGLAILLLLAFLMPHFSWNWIMELLIVIFYFPLIVCLGAGSTLSSGLSKLCRFSGNISYPLYMSHYAAIWVFGNYLVNYKLTTNQLFYVVPIGTAVLVGFAYLVMVLYDIPVRKYLTKKRKKAIVSTSITS